MDSFLVTIPFRICGLLRVIMVEGEELEVLEEAVVPVMEDEEGREEGVPSLEGGVEGVGDGRWKPS